VWKIGSCGNPWSPTSAEDKAPREREYMWWRCVVYASNPTSYCENYFSSTLPLYISIDTACITWVYTARRNNSKGVWMPNMLVLSEFAIPDPPPLCRNIRRQLGARRSVYTGPVMQRTCLKFSTMSCALECFTSRLWGSSLLSTRCQLTT